MDHPAMHISKLENDSLENGLPDMFDLGARLNNISSAVLIHMRGSLIHEAFTPATI